MSDDSLRWDALGEAIKARETELGLSQADLVRASGVGEVTVRKLERGEPGNYRRPNLRKISLGLKWPADAVERILAGEVPDEDWEERSPLQVVKDNATRPVTTAGRSGATLEDLEALDPEAAAKVRADIEFYLRRAQERR